MKGLGARGEMSRPGVVWMDSDSRARLDLVCYPPLECSLTTLLAGPIPGLIDGYTSRLIVNRVRAQTHLDQATVCAAGR